MIEALYETDGVQHVQVDTIEDISEFVKQHGGDENSDFAGLLNGSDTLPTIIGETTCNDGVRVCFHAPNAETAARIWDQMF